MELQCTLVWGSDTDNAYPKPAHQSLSVVRPMVQGAEVPFAVAATVDFAS